MRNLLFMIASLAIPAGLAAQTSAPACDGRPAVIRVSEITPNGTAAGFLAAAKAHQEWYKSHGSGPDHHHADAFVMLHRDNSTIESEINVCLPPLTVTAQEH